MTAHPLSEQQAAVVQAVVEGGRPLPDWVTGFWQEKIDWMKAGDRTPEGGRAIRCRGEHYVALGKKNPKTEKGFLGYGGRVFKFELVDGTVIESNDVWHQGLIPLKYRQLLPDNAEFLKEEHRPTWSNSPPPPQPPVTYKQHWMRQISPWPLKIWNARLDIVTGPDGYDEHVDRSEVTSIDDETANVFSSEIAEGAVLENVIERGPDGEYRHKSAAGLHILAIDVDHRCHLAESSTPGHYHLAIAVPMPWYKLRRILRAMKSAGIIQPGYYSASVARGATFLRLPWVRKEEGPY